MNHWVSVASVLILIIATSSYAARTQSELADRIVVKKSERTMNLIREGKIIHSYTISLGKHPNGPKARQGDGKTPEGIYVIDWKHPTSRFHRALHISYPNSSDLGRAREQGVAAGGDIMIHGLPSRWSWIGGMHRLWDWTDGCIALTNTEIEEIWELVQVGTPIEILP